MYVSESVSDPNYVLYDVDDNNIIEILGIMFAHEIYLLFVYYERKYFFF